MQNKYRNWLIAGLGGLAIIGATVLLSPFIKTAYQRHKANKSLTSTSVAVEQLETTLERAEFSIDNNSFYNDWR